MGLTVFAWLASSFVKLVAILRGRAHLPPRLTIHATTTMTTIKSKIGVHIQPNPPIQPLPHILLFIMFPLCAIATLVVASNIVETARADNCFMIISCKLWNFGNAVSGVDGIEKMASNGYRFGFDTSVNFPFWSLKWNFALTGLDHKSLSFSSR